MGLVNLRYDRAVAFAEAQWMFSGRHVYVDTDLQEEPMPGHGMLNLRVGGQKKNVRVTFAIDNLLVVGLAFGNPVPLGQQRGDLAHREIARLRADAGHHDLPGGDPVGQIVRIRDLPFRVVGVLASKGQSLMGQDQDDLAVMPYSTVQKKLLGQKTLSVNQGIMNIMLVSVTERTREIGISMAVGARPGYVRGQFLTESVVLSLLGGLIGVVVGSGLAVAIAQALGWPIAVSILSVLVSFGFAAFVGIFFGYYPAHKAASMDPIDALRYE